MGRLGDPELSLDRMLKRINFGGFEPSPHGRFIAFFVFHHGWFVSGFCECFCGGIHNPFPRTGRSLAGPRTYRSVIKRGPV